MDLPFETMGAGEAQECIYRISLKSSDCRIISFCGRRERTTMAKIGEGRDWSGKLQLVHVFSGTGGVVSILLGDPEKSPWIGKKDVEFSVPDLKTYPEQDIKPLNADEDASTNGSPMLKTKDFYLPGNFKDLNRDEHIIFPLERRKDLEGGVRVGRQGHIMERTTKSSGGIIGRMDLPFETKGTGEIEECIDRISPQSSDCQIISICGMGGIGKTTLAKIGEGRDLSGKFQLVQVFSGTGGVRILLGDPEKSPRIGKNEKWNFSTPSLKMFQKQNFKPLNADEDVSTNGSPMLKTKDFYLPGNFKDLTRDERILFVLERRKDLEGSDRAKEHILDQHILLNRGKYLEGIADIMERLERLKYASREDWKRSEGIMGRMERQELIMDEHILLKKRKYLEGIADIMERSEGWDKKMWRKHLEAGSEDIMGRVEGQKHIMDEHNLLKWRKYLEVCEEIIEEVKISLDSKGCQINSIYGMHGLGKATLAKKVYQRSPGQGLDLSRKFLLELVVDGSDGIHVLPGDPENSPGIGKNEKRSFSVPVMKMAPKQNIKPPLTGDVDDAFTNGSPMLKMKHFHQQGNFEDLNRLPSNMKFQKILLLILATVVMMGTFVSESRFASTHSPLQDKRNYIATRLFVVFNSVAFVTSLSGVIYLLHEFPLKPWSQISVSMLFGSYMVLLFKISPYEALSLLLSSIPPLLFAAAANQTGNHSWLHPPKQKLTCTLTILSMNGDNV